MPYINKDQRSAIDVFLNPLIKALLCWSEGDLNYVITRLLVEGTKCHEDPSYGKINKIMGVLDSAGKEIYRRIGAPYEDVKRSEEENGDLACLQAAELAILKKEFPEIL